ncbi:MAG: prephenate dehydratase [Elusimicrobiota bacterium]
MKRQKSIKEMRTVIDNVDRKILELLNQRARHSIEIGKIKKEHNREFYIPDREKEILKRLAGLNKGPMPGESVNEIFSEILHSSRALQKKLKIAFLGPEATFTHQAAVKNFGSSCEYVSEKAISDVFRAVEKRRADYGVVPVENSTEGIINHTLDMFLESELSICAEINIAIEQCLLSVSTAISSIKKIYSHPQAIAQCRNYIEEKFPTVRIIEEPSTAVAARLAAGERTSAAIASALAAKLYGLKIIAKGIEDIAENYTRFLAIGRGYPGPSGYDRTSIMFSIKDKVGALHDILIPFKRQNINLTKIESRPTKRRAWEYVFFIDFEGHIENKNVRRAIEGLKEHCVFVKILGSYPKAD